MRGNIGHFSPPEFRRPEWRMEVRVAQVLNVAALSIFEKADQRTQKMREKRVPNGIVLCPQILSTILR